MKHTKHSIKPYSKDLSEAQRSFYKIIEGLSHTAWFLNKKTKTKDTNHVNKTKIEVYRYLLKKKDGMPTGASSSLDA